MPTLLPPPAIVAALPDCAGQISIGLDGEDGNFSGMSQAGTLLVVRNIGAGACRMPALPALRFENEDGKPAELVRQAPPGLHPGPVILPIGLAAGAEATAILHWVSGDVYDGHHCVTPAKLVLQNGASTYRLSWTGQLCGPAGAPVPYQQAPLRTDPTLTRP